MKYFKPKRSFKKELRRQLRLALLATIGFTVAFAWRNAIFNSSNNLMKEVISSSNILLNEIFTATFITSIAVILAL